MFGKEKSMHRRAKEANKVLRNLHIKRNSESDIQIRENLAMELLGEEYSLMDKHSKASFVQLHGIDVMNEVRNMLLEAGVLTKGKLKKIENKKK